MKDTLAKLRALVDMKTSLVRALAADLEDACNKIEARDIELDVYKRANMALRKRNEELELFYKLAEDDVFLLTERSEYRAEKMTQMAQDIELLKTEKRQLQERLDHYKAAPEWWQEMDEDEDYIASLEIQAAGDIPFEVRTADEEEEA